MASRYRYRYRVRRRWLRRRDRRALAGAALAGLALAFVVHAAGPGGSSPAVPAQAAAAPASVSGSVALGERLARGYGWGSGRQWNCLYALWERESGWSRYATNPKSGAYGVAQALGHGPGNQYPAGPANPPQSDPAAQIRWGLGYIRQTPRYGSPCAAWAHEEARGWY